MSNRDSGFVRTVLGLMKPDELGVVLAHEHVFLDVSSRWRAGDSELPNAESIPFDASHNGLGRWNSHIVKDNLALSFERDFELMLDEIQRFARAAGQGACLVDLTPLSIGGHPSGLVEVSKRSGLHIVSGAGFYVHSTHPDWVEEASEDELYDFIHTEVTVGRGDSGVRAGIIGEIGTSERLEPCERRILRAAARVGVHTGIAVNVHCNPSTEEVTQDVIEVLLGEGLPADRVYLSHLDEIDDLGYLRRVLDRGVTIGIDSFGQEGYFSPTWPARTDHDKIRTMMSLIADGFVSQLVVAQDVCKKQHLSRFGGFGYSHVVERVFPRAAQHFGLQPDDAQKVLTENPRRLLTIQ